MIEFSINKEAFKFSYLPDYAGYLLAHKLNEFVTVGIRFSREANLPLLKSLNKFPEQELVALGMESNRQMLEAIAKNRIAEHIEEGAKKWINNTLHFFDKDDVIVEDLTLGFYLRRKLFAHFLDAYTKNVVLQKFIIGEVDVYTTQEELTIYNIYVKMRQEELNQVNQELSFHKDLLLEAQELENTGSFLINVKEPDKSFYTPEYKKILEIDERIDIDAFMEYVHPEDKVRVFSTINAAYKEGGKFGVTYRYKKSSKEKRIWSKGFIIVEEGKPVIIRGIVKEVE